VKISRKDPAFEHEVSVASTIRFAHGISESFSLVFFRTRVFYVIIRFLAVFCVLLLVFTLLIPILKSEMPSSRQ